MSHLAARIRDFSFFRGRAGRKCFQTSSGPGIISAEHISQKRRRQPVWFARWPPARDATKMTPSSVVDGSSSHDRRSARLLLKARGGQRESIGQLLQLYRNYLVVLATTQFDRRLRRRLSPSDLVQETMLAALRDFGQFQGCTERQFLAWLRQILINSLHRAIETHLKTKMRDVRCEVSIEHVSRALDRSTVNMAELFVDPSPSPSAPMQRRESAVAFANQLAALRPHYRDVIIMRNLQGLPFEEIADRMQRNPGAVRMLWLRAVDKLKQVARPADEP
jgi:RNA polymerase sigma-70 factor (ECF subfamily)